MDRELRQEAHSLLRSARHLLAELAEEADAFGAPPPRPELPAARPDRPEARSDHPEARSDDPEARSGHPEARSEELEARTAPAPVPASAFQSDLLGEQPAFGPDPTLEQVREGLGECTRCRLCEGRTQIVFGDGDPAADLMFIGEGPGEQEDLQGIPFVGRAGELLTKMIERGLELPRSAVYICNIVKCRPPGNRTPLADEVAACRPFLDGQIDAVRPKVIVALGKPAASLLLGRDIAITRVRGTWHDYRGIPLMPTFHPAFILRQYTEQNRRLVWEDLKEALAKARASAF